ncbi:MAG TPA: nucleotidyltransferase domain-containing protein [Caulobacteraceae bacterium]
MDLRCIPDAMESAVVASIDARLDAVIEAHGVSIPLAIESGSRAWGFPSPDSDYDCRFVFVRPPAQHLSLWPLRDVIEEPPDGVFDVNGWDLAKALRLLVRGNAVIIEWLQSPIIYRGDAWFRDAFLDLARSVASREAIARHYLHLGERQRRVHFGDGRTVAQKKIFYALRPAATLRWMRLNSAAPFAPMHFPTLMAECEPPVALRAEIEDLMERKAITHELGVSLLSPAIAGFIDAEFEMARRTSSSAGMPAADDGRRLAKDFYSSMVRRFDI